MTPEISVVVSTKNRAAMLAGLFATLEAQDFAGSFELVLVDDGSDDDTGAVARTLAARASFPVNLLTWAASGGPAAGRNDGAYASKAPLLAFTDDDCRPSSGWLQAGSTAMAGGHHVVVGAVTPPRDGSRRRPRRRELWVRHFRFFECANAFYRAEDFRAVGGFNPAFTTVGGEDTDLGLRVCATGASPFFEPRAHVFHPARSGELPPLLREAARWYDIPLLYKLHPEQRQHLPYRPYVWKEPHQWVLVALGTTAATAAIRPRALPLAGLAYLPWLFTRVLRGRHERWKDLPDAPALFLVDVVEISAMVRGSIRHRSPLL